jgi:F-type H+-transporting ATPase subunit c
MAIGAGLAVLTGFGAGAGIGIVFARAVEAIGRQPEASKRIMPMTILGATLAESTAMYGVVVSLLILLNSGIL